MDVNNATVSLTGGQSDLVSEEKPQGKRLTLTLTNLNASGGDDVYVTIGVQAAANIGIKISPQQTITWSSDAGYKPPSGRVFGYAAGASSLALYEEVED